MNGLSLKAPNDVAAPRVAAHRSFTPVSSPSPSPCVFSRTSPPQDCNTHSSTSRSPMLAPGEGAAETGGSGGSGSDDSDGGSGGEQQQWRRAAGGAQTQEGR